MRKHDDEAPKPTGLIQRVQAALARELLVEHRGLRRLSTTNLIVAGLICLDVLARVLETERTISVGFQEAFALFERVILFVFTVELALRCFAAGHEERYRGFRGRIRYFRTFGAAIDVLAVLPSLIFVGVVDLKFLRSIRILHMFRFVYFGPFGRAISLLRVALKARAYELTVSFVVTMTVLLVASTGIYYAEREVNAEAFGSIPRALWWAIVTVTTVGYGDAVPVTALGKVLGSIVALLSVVLIAVPTGLVASAVSDASRARRVGDGR